MKFDYIIGNPPYQGTNSSIELWQQITLSCYDLLDDNGEMTLIHPLTWQFATNKITNNKEYINKVRNMFLSNDIYDYKSFSTKQGSDTFGAATNFCTYRLKKQNTQKYFTYTGSDNKKNKILKSDIKDFNICIPVSNVNEFNKLSNKQNKIEFHKNSKIKNIENGVEFLSIIKLNIDTTKNIKKIKIDINSVDKNQFRPKIILSRGGTYTFLDLKGEYLSQTDGIFITDRNDNIDNLKKIQKVFQDKGFKTLLSDISGSNDYRIIDPKRLNRNFLAELNEDFYTEY